MADALWIDETYLMGNSVIYDNVDMKIITPSILFAQKTHIKDLLGTRLFDVIQTQINAQTYESRITDLLVLVKDALMYRVMEDATSEMVYKWMNKGIVVKIGDNVQASTSGVIEFVQNKNRVKAEMFEERVRKFLYRYLNIYPEYMQNTQLDDVVPKTISARTGIFLNDNGIECDKKRFFR